ncbi:hypothetical protein B0H14DRAFT_2750642 [Mycena olivaceomarginata]|nr:hypothetical protein B0H14DRAFT_2750642 [Mycena olivaceomarginata]
MRKLWNAAYGIGGEGAVASMAAMIERARRMGFEEGRRNGFEEGRQAGEKDTLSMDTFEVLFAAGKMSGIATGMELGREGGTCRAFGNTAVMDSLPPPQSLPLDNDARTFRVPGAFLVHTGFNWADNAESLPIHSVLVVSPQASRLLRPAYWLEKMLSTRSSGGTHVITEPRHRRFSILELLAWVWMVVHRYLQGHVGAG